MSKKVGVGERKRSMMRVGNEYGRGTGIGELMIGESGGHGKWEMGGMNDC